MENFAREIEERVDVVYILGSRGGGWRDFFEIYGWNPTLLAV